MVFYFKSDRFCNNWFLSKNILTKFILIIARLFFIISQGLPKSALSAKEEKR